MESITLFITIIAAAGWEVQGLPPPGLDPCLSGGYKELNQTYRSTGYDFRAIENPVCDDRLRRGWYRFVDINGKPADMPNKCPGANTCGTKTAIWMDGKFPKPDDGIVTNGLCGRVQTEDPTSDCCEYTDEVFVKNCGTFFIYYLSAVFDCPSGYCAGTIERCPVGRWSPTGLAPCRDPSPVLTTPPEVQGANTNKDGTFDFKCQITFPGSETDTNFQVVWTFNGQADPAIGPVTLTGSQRVAVLSGEQLQRHVDTEVGCQVTTYYTGREKDKTTYKSNANFFGIRDTKLNGPILRGNTSFVFECEPVLDSADPNLKFEIVWTFDNKPDPEVPPQIITGKTKKSTLQGTALATHFNSNVGCQARLVFDSYNYQSKFHASQNYFAGIIVTPPSLQISSTEAEKEVTVSSTLPVVCDSDRDCCLTIDLSVDNQEVVSLKQSCSVQICLSDWDKTKKQSSITIKVVPSRNALGGVTRQTVLRFQTLQVQKGLFQTLITGYSIAAIQISVQLEAGFKCSITGDPHFRGFDFPSAYHLYKTGDFSVYEVKSRGFSVQIRTWRCYSVTCVCGVVVKEGNDIVRAYGCDGPGTLLQATNVDVPYKLSPGAVVQRSADRAHISIRLSSGSEVTLYIHPSLPEMNVYIQTPAYDKGKAMGACGTNDGIPNNDFTRPDGTVLPPCGGSCIYDEFFESWRVSGTDSMFISAPQQVPEEPPSQFCSCATGSNGKSVYTCTARGHIGNSVLPCDRCDSITDSLKPSAWGQTKDEQKPYKHQEVPPVDPNKKWPNAHGVTELQARQMCNEVIRKSPLFDQCKEVPLDNIFYTVMEECLGDILFGETTDALDGVTSSYTNKCQLKLAEDEKNYVKNPDGSLTFNPTGQMVPQCPDKCEEHGTCSTKGFCQCQKGWTGDDCQIDQSIGPQIWPPGTVSVNGDRRSVQYAVTNAKPTDTFKCSIQPVTAGGTKSGEAVIIDGVKTSATSVSCPLPALASSFQRFGVSISSDGKTYGNELPIFVLDNSCLDCTSGMSTIKGKTCYIGNVCFQDGVLNSKNTRQVCSPNVNPTAWTSVAKTT